VDVGALHRTWPADRDAEGEASVRRRVGAAELARRGGQLGGVDQPGLGTGDEERLPGGDLVRNELVEALLAEVVEDRRVGAEAAFVHFVARPLRPAVERPLLSSVLLRGEIDTRAPGAAVAVGLAPHEAAPSRSPAGIFRFAGEIGGGRVIAVGAGIGRIGAAVRTGAGVDARVRSSRGRRLALGLERRDDDLVEVRLD